MGASDVELLLVRLKLSGLYILTFHKNLLFLVLSHVNSNHRHRFRVEKKHRANVSSFLKSVTLEAWPDPQHCMLTHQ